jgi:preprotein translocase subunit SecD/SecD/SecF fusion protein
MKSRRNHILAIAGLVVLIIGSLFSLLPLKQADSLSWKVGSSAKSFTLNGSSASVVLEGGIVGVASEAASGTLLATVERVTDATSTVGGNWRIVASPTTTETILVGGVATRDAMVSYGTTFTVHAQEFTMEEGRSSITQSLDLRGGLSVLLTPKEPTDAASMQRALEIMNNRVNGLGASEAVVQLENENKAILVQLPGIKDAGAALAVLKSTGQLEFVEVATLDTTLQAQIQDGFVMTPGTYEKSVFMKGDVIKSASAGVSGDKLKPGFVVNMSFDATGTRIWAEVTKRAAPTNAQIAIVLDHIVQSAPQVISEIPDGNTEISGSFTSEEAKRLAAVLQYGALPVDLVPSQTESVGPTLGQDALAQGVLAAVVGLIIVGLYLAAYYRGFGVLAWFSLGSFAVVYLGVLSVLSKAGQYALSLPGIAGIVLSIGLAADTSILIFERYKEEIEMGRTPRTAAKAGTKHAILTSLDADAVTFASAIPLFLFAIGTVKGFALTLMIGIICDLTIAMLFTRPMVILLSEKVVAKMPAFFGVKGGRADA